MTARTRLKTLKWRIWGVVLAASATGYVSLQFLSSETEQSSPWLSSRETTATNTREVAHPKDKELSAAPVWQAYRDPKTGQFRRPPANVFPSEGFSPGLSILRNEGVPPLEKPQELMSPVVGGGVVTKVRLRFRRPLVATKDAQGNLKIQHVPQEADLNGEP